MKCGVYTITNTINTKIYIGSTTRLFCQRWGDHRVGLRKGNHSNIHLQRAWNKYGEKAFEFKVIELVDNPKNVLEREQYWMDKFDVYNLGYNRNPRAENSYGIKRTTEQKKAQSKLDNWKKANKAWKGSKHSEYSKQIIREKRAKQVLLPWTDKMKKNQSTRATALMQGNKHRMKYFNIKATKGDIVHTFKDMREAMKFFDIPNNGPIGRVLRGERQSWHGWKFTTGEMTK